MDKRRRSERDNAAEYAFLELVREFDIRQGWKSYQFNNCAEWLNMKCGIVVGTAREKVRVATALFDLPKISRAFTAGELSYSKVRSLSHVATPHNEAQLLGYAQQATTEQVQRRCPQMHNADRAASTHDVNEIHRGRFLGRSVDGSGRMTISIELTEEAGALVMAAQERAIAEADTSRDALDRLFSASPPPARGRFPHQDEPRGRVVLRNGGGKTDVELTRPDAHRGGRGQARS